MKIPFVFYLYILFNESFSEETDSSIDGEPVVTCGESDIAINIKTKTVFDGITFVKGKYSQPECRSSAAAAGQTAINISVGLMQCGCQRYRMAGKQKGISIKNTVVVAFHSGYISKKDRAFEVECFYTEAEKSVSAELEVSTALTTSFQSKTVMMMPACKYEILNGGPNGRPLAQAAIGQKIYHKWTCESSESNLFCMTVHSCYVDGYHGNRVDLIDPNGCAVDRILLRNLNYTSDLAAGQETHVFKYADLAQLLFQCQISIGVKQADNGCSAPKCSDPVRGKRYAADARHLFVSDHLESSLQISSNSKQQSGGERRNSSILNEFEDRVDGNICLDVQYLQILLMFLTTGLLCFTLACSAMLQQLNRKSN